MSHAISFDTLAFVKKLEAAGTPAPQAEATANAIAEVLDTSNESFATKSDINKITSELTRVENKITSELTRFENNIRQEMKAEIANNKVDTLKWMFGMLFAQSGFIITFLKYFH